MADILVIDDEPHLLRLLTRLLSDAGHCVTTAGGGLDGLRQALVDAHDLILLDLMMPDLSGDEVLRALVPIRPEVQVMVLSSVVDIDRRVEVLDGGAVDFVAKPFKNQELLARVRARLRSPRPNSAGAARTADAVRLDAQHHRLLMDGRHIALSQREFLLLAYLMERQGEVCPREDLLARVWGIDFDPGTNVVDVCVSRLRMKASAGLIETVRNVGYRFTA